jgi:DNA topoisomerase-3
MSGPARQCPIYVFNGSFKGHKALFKVTSVCGHVFNRDFPKEFQSWKNDPEGLFNAPTVRKADKHGKPVANHLATVSRSLDFLVLWLDCDREGENICFEVMDIMKKNIPKSKLQRVYRAKFSSIAPKDILASFNNLHMRPNFNESVSVDARQVLDLKIGVAFSRF